MKMQQLPHFNGWEYLAHHHLPVIQMYLLYALPLSLIAPLMIYYAGMNYTDSFMPTLTKPQLQTISLVFFLVETAMVFLVAGVIRLLGNVIDIHPSYEDAFKLATIAPTPLWLMPLFLFIPSVVVNLSALGLALLASGALIYYGVPNILKVEDKGHAVLMSGTVFATGLVAWAMMMYLTLLTWSIVTSTFSF